MKNRLYIIMLITFAAMPCLSQLNVVSISKIADAGHSPLIYPSGQFVLVQDAGEQGLTQINLSNNQQKLIVSEHNIEGDIYLSDGGTMVAYRTALYQDHLRYHVIRSADINSGMVKDLDTPSRELYALRFTGGKIKIAKRTTMRSVRLLNDIRKVEQEYIVAVEDDDLILYIGNKRKVISPNGKDTYLWERISPDEKNIVYVAVNDKCHTYVYNIDSGQLKDLGYYIGAPTWLDNNWIIGQQDEDDGHQMTRSRLVAVQADGSNFQVLPTKDLIMPINPSASKDGKIAFENEGKIYIMEVK